MFIYFMIDKIVVFVIINTDENKSTGFHMSNFEVLRQIACKVGVSAPESDSNIYDVMFLNSIKRAVERVLKESEQSHKRAAELENTLGFTRHTTAPAESVAGIALRSLGDQNLWVDVARLNSLDHPDMGPHDYYPVGTSLILPARKST
jgi:hypothetical protein